MSENTEVKQKNPHLFCLITGKSRPTTWAYLKDKAERLGTDAESLINNYVSREAITQLLDGRTVEQIRASHKEAPANEISTERLAELIRLNSKAKKAAEKFNVVATTTVNVEATQTNDEVPTEVVAEATTEVVAEEKPKKKSRKKVKAEEPAMVTEETPAEVSVD